MLNSQSTELDSKPLLLETKLLVFEQERRFLEHQQLFLDAGSTDQTFRRQFLETKRRDLVESSTDLVAEPPAGTLVISRPSLIAVLHTITVVAITSTRRGTPIEVPVGVEVGLKHPSCIDLANVFTIRKANLRRYVGSLDEPTMRAVCRALALATG